VVSVLAWSAVAALHALVPGAGALFALRIALGFTEGPSFPGAAQTVKRVLPANESARGYGVLFTGSSIGGLSAPPVARGLFLLAGWRVAFLGTAAIGLCWVPLWIAVTRQPDVRAPLDAGLWSRDARSELTVAKLLRDPRVIRALFGIFAAAPLIGFV